MPFYLINWSRVNAAAPDCKARPLMAAKASWASAQSISAPSFALCRVTLRMRSSPTASSWSTFNMRRITMSSRSSVASWLGHQGPLSCSDKGCARSARSVLVKWESWEITIKPLAIIAINVPVACAICARGNGLLSADGWRCFKPAAQRKRRGSWLRAANQAKLRPFKNAPCCKFGYQTARGYKEAITLDHLSQSTRWQGSTKQAEAGQLTPASVTRLMAVATRMSAPLLLDARRSEHTLHSIASMMTGTRATSLRHPPRAQGVNSGNAPPQPGR